MFQDSDPVSAKHFIAFTIALPSRKSSGRMLFKYPFNLVKMTLSLLQTELVHGSYRSPEI